MLHQQVEENDVCAEGRGIPAEHLHQSGAGGGDLWRAELTQSQPVHPLADGLHALGAVLGLDLGVRSQEVGIRECGVSLAEVVDVVQSLGVAVRL